MSRLAPMLLLVTALPAAAQDGSAADSDTADPDEDAAELVVTAKRSPQSVAQTQLDAAALRTTPARDADDWLRALPGLHISRHGGRGKAAQILLRGFDADHGADLAVSVAGIPINEPSHVHGHGYADVSFLPRFVVRGITLTPGAASARVGDFGIAGHVDYQVGLSDPGWQLRLAGGTDRSGAAFVGWRPRSGADGTFLALDADLGLGVTDGRGWRHLRVGGGLEGKLAPRLTGELLLFGHDGRFAAPGAIREELLEETGFYGSVGDPDRGTSRRLLLGGRLHGEGDRRTWTAGLSFGARQYRLDANPTGFFYDAAMGDRQRQDHASLALLADASASRGFDVAGTPWTVRGGGAVRQDGAARSLAQLSPTDQPYGTTEELGVQHTDLSAWAEMTARPHDAVEATVGVRAGSWRVRDRAEDQAVGTNSWVPFVLPKARLLVAPAPSVDIVASYGRAQRSPEATQLSPGLGQTPIADSAEVGVVTHPTYWLDVSATAFGTWLGDERIFDHVTTRFIGAGRSRRLGVLGTLAVRPTRWLQLAGDLTWTDAELVDAGTPVPYAPPLVGGARLTVTSANVGKVSLDAGLHAWVLGARPLTDGFVEQASFAGRLTTGATWTTWRFDLGFDNVFGNRWSDGVFVHPSRPTPSSPDSQLPARHVSAGEPFAATLAVTKRF